ncbi:MAG: ATP synthase F1 subunit epsilon [Rhodospirillaceae bacterium]|nr:ATP synthase F1 subunit epsilon [Rhodospirillaceae bacterium]
MADNTLPEMVEFELVAPERLVQSKSVGMVVVPCAEGDIGVLPGHAPLIGTVRPGVVDIFENDKITDRVFVSGGFVEVTPDRCTLLAEEAIAVSDITRESADARLTQAQDLLAQAKSESEKTRANAAVEMAEAMLAALGVGAAQH